ncbi:MAG: gluconate 2-dehydrogenase subunit 3 family protein [Chromatiales bacterium]|jgi:hypothetical protein
MPLTRRRLLIGFATSWALCRLLPARAASRWLSQLTQSSLRAYVDTLIPADETPSGTSLHVDRQLLRVAGKQRDYQRLLQLGLDWLNAQARAQYGRDFPRLDDEGREAIVGRAAAASYETLPRTFFERTRADAFFHYYGRPESWQRIAHYRGPPQPLGFLDYTRPPADAR